MVKTNDLTNVKKGETAGFRPELLAELVNRCIGSISIGDFAEKSSVSRSWLSKCKNKCLVYPPTRRTLKKLQEHSSDPHVSYDDLLNAAGLSPNDEDTKEPSLTSLLADNSLGGLKIFMETLKLGGKTCFSVRHQPDIYTIRIDGGAKTYVCLPAFTHGDSSLTNVIIGEATYRLVQETSKKKESDDVAKDVDITLLTDSEDAYTFFDVLRERYKECSKVILTNDYSTASRITP